MSLQKSKSHKIKKTISDSFQRDFEEIKKGSRNEMTTVSQNYLKAIVDTRSAPKVGVPTNIGGFPGRTGIVRYTEQVEVYTGTAGFGYVSVNLTGNQLSPYGGPFNDTPVIEYTSAVFTGNSIAAMGSPVPAGMGQNSWQKSEFKRAGLVESDLQYRVVGCTIKVFPEASALSQNGRIILLEPPSHAPLNSSFIATGPAIENAPTARVIRAVQTGELREQVVLNWHPKGYTGDKFGTGDFDFQTANPTPVSPFGILPATDLVVAFQCSTGTPSQFHVEVTAMYELRGLRVTNVKPRLVDSRGMDLIQNVFSSKIISGYIGKPEHIYESYLYKIWEGARKVGGFLSKHEKEITEGVGRGLKALGGFM